MKVVDLFSGCGGLSLGFEKAGLSVVRAFEYWDDAIEVYRANLKHPVQKQDLRDVPAVVSQLREMEIDAIIGGPPCQEFSHAGKREEGGKANLTVSFAEIVAGVRPRWFVMENVARALKSAAFTRARHIFSQAGYGMTIEILDASLCGVPQKRKRLVCVGKLNEDNEFLKFGFQSRLATKPLTVREYFKDRLAVEHYYRHPRNYSRRAVYSVNEPAATVRGVNRPVPNGYKMHPADSVDPAHARALSTEERAEIQTFPSAFIWRGSKTAREQMIGNAVPVKLAEFVARCVTDYDRGEISTCANLRLPLRLSEDDVTRRNRQLQELAVS